MAGQKNQLSRIHAQHKLQLSDACSASFPNRPAEVEFSNVKSKEVLAEENIPPRCYKLGCPSVQPTRGPEVRAQTTILID